MIEMINKVIKFLDNEQIKIGKHDSFVYLITYMSTTIDDNQKKSAIRFGRDLSDYRRLYPTTDDSDQKKSSSFWAKSPTFFDRL